MDPRDHHDPLLEAFERTLGLLDRTEPVDFTDRLEKLLEADMDEMPARNVYLLMRFLLIVCVCRLPQLVALWS